MNKIVMIIALALVFSMNANAKTYLTFSNCGQIGEEGRKTLEMWDCEHQQNLQRKEWFNKAGLGYLIK